MIYYIVSGEMTVTTDEGEFILHAGDSICFQPGDGRSCRNTGMEAATMLVAAVAHFSHGARLSRRNKSG